jgi:rod shape-determining protein MreC
VLKGKSSGELVIDKIMADEEVKPGDRVLTSGGDQIFPKGLLIGTVDRIEKGPEFLQVSVKPSAALNRLEEVLVIMKKEEREPPSTATGMRASDILAERLPSVPDKPAVPANAVRGSAAQGSVPPNAVRIHPVAGGGSQAAGQTKAPAVAGSAVAKPGTTAPVSSSGSTGTPGSKPATTSSNPVVAPTTKLAAPANSKPAANTAPSQPQPDPTGDTPQ